MAGMEEWDDKDLVMISAIQHYSYCPRQCALIHLEQTFTENIHTIQGRFVHEKVDQPDSVITEGIRYETALPLWSGRLGLIGKGDLVEFHGDIPYPVEYKHGRKKHQIHDELQLCAQAMCLEEMLDCAVPKGAVFYFSSRKRREVLFSPILRQKVEEITLHIRELFKDGQLPPAVADTRCNECSLSESCVPELVGNRSTLKRLTKELFTVNQ
ncbi:CRISPR-associated protein Cas4 [Heliophilum fasciatum]|uniref:CRISPR-associated exonuclease Cas4 n=1 Tax=Heliophilum fasciatum TaxID=35700 RepID=A0A4R2RFP7_9FIRM|nr:CRISPR-associated protein Cas4 [Heliophilum fasciatum]MCW2279029.1 CRISPR-associated exonuclease Cas4 [Heliophilum fasciatum]TCP61733.1 CRISPR-associated Cas4 family exonuclease [Heliophilum fasciatum]